MTEHVPVKILAFLCLSLVIKKREERNHRISAGEQLRSFGDYQAAVWNGDGGRTAL